MIGHLGPSRRIGTKVFCAALALTVALLSGAAAAAAAVVNTCGAAKLKKEGLAAAKVLKCHATAAKKQQAVNAACIQKAQTKLDEAFTKADESGPCSDGQGFAWSLVTESGTGLGSLLRPPALNADTHFACAGVKLRTAAKLASKKATCHAKAVKKGTPVDAACLQKADADFATAFQAVEAAGGCGTNGDAAPARAFVDQFVTSALELLTADQLPIRCCAASTTAPVAVSGCADLVLDTCTQAATLLASVGGSATQGEPQSVCNGATGSCQPTRTGTSTCCEAEKNGLQICAEGPSLAVKCTLFDSQAGVQFTEYPGQVCRDHFPASPTCDP